MHLSNPYSRPAAVPRRRGRIALTTGALVGAAAAVAGCSTDPPTSAAPTAAQVTAPPPANPLDAASPSVTPPAPPQPAAVPQLAAPQPSPAVAPDRLRVPGERAVGTPQLDKPGADYRVGRGDTLSGIAAALDVDGGWRALWSRNCDVLFDPDFILPGQELDVDGAAVAGCG